MVTKDKLERARQLRREMTPAERALWNEVRANKLGVHFRRQQIIAGFIIDFYCHAASLVIEVDGEVHQEAQQRQSDAKRDIALNDLGLTIVRYENREVLSNISSVVARIKVLIAN